MENVSFFSMLFSLLFGVSTAVPVASPEPPLTVPEPLSVIRYVALGDSYTIGAGVEEYERWPNLLVDHLNEEGIEIELVTNPAQTGWTTKQLLSLEMPVLQAAQPDFVTVMIGVNDYFQRVAPELFQERFAQILDEVQTELADPSQVVVVNIPDYSVTPTGARYDFGGVSEGIQDFNRIIEAESSQRGLQVVNVYDVSLEASERPEWIATDGLHPSGLQYQAWEELIFPVVQEVLEGR